MARRYIAFGVGAVGGTIAGLLSAAGTEVVAIARGDHLAALQRDGLTLHQPGGTRVIRFAGAAGSPEEVDWRPDDIVLVAMKTQDTARAVDALAAIAPPTVGVVCAQNGVENERLAARRFADVHAMVVMLPAAHLEPGVVVAYGAPAPGILDVGGYPTGVNRTDEVVASDLRDAGFSSESKPDIMRWKYAKLRMNLGNAIEAACGSAARSSDVYRRAAAEASACFEAAGIDVASPEEDAARRADIMRITPVEGQRRGGSSSWQSLARESGSIESDYLNGEIALLGRLHGIDTPVNAAVQRVANRMARERRQPGSMALEDLVREIDGPAGGQPPVAASSASSR